MFLRVVEESLALQAAYLARHEGAAQSACSSFDAILALQLAGRFFSAGGGARLRAVARTALIHKIQTRLRPDGGYIDPQPNIQLRLAMTVMAHLLFDAEQDRAVSRVLEEKLRLILEFLEGMVLPDGNLPLFGPLAQSPGDTLDDLFALAAVRLEEPRWKSLVGRFGMMPYMLLGEEGKASFERLPDSAFSHQPCLRPTSGLYRLGDEGGSALLIQGQAPESDRGHQDFLSYHLSIRGQQVVVDSGAFMPPSNRAPEYFATPLAHNVLLVDGKGPQAVALPPEPLIREGRVSGAGYSALRLRNPGFAFLGLEHERRWFLLDMGAWVVLDCLEGRGAHRVVSLLHFYPTFEIEAGDDQAVARSRSFAATIIPIGRPPRTIVATKGDHPEFPGWYAPDFGIKYPAGVLALEWSTPNSPWVGGYVIAPDDGVKCGAEAMDASSRALSIELFGRRYSLPLG